MPLRWDSLLVRELAAELDSALAGAHARALRLDGDSRKLTLLLRGITLEWSLHPGRGEPVLLPPSEPADGDLPLAGRVRRVASGTDERVLQVELLPHRGRPARDLVVELLGNQWNAMVVERPSGTVRHVLVRKGPPRPARVGTPHHPPPPSTREGAQEPLTFARWREILEPVPPPERARVLVATVAWTSPLNAKALLEAHPDPARALAEGHALWVALAFGGAPPEPVLRRVPGGAQPYPWPLPGSEGVRIESLLAGFRARIASAQPGPDTDAGDAPAGSAPGGASEELLTALESARDSRLRRLVRLEAEMEALEDEADLRTRADLILARLSQIPAGAARAVVEGFDGRDVALELDPAVPPRTHAAELYERAARVARARERIPGLLRSARSEAEAMDALLSRARAGHASEEEVRAVLPAREEVAATEGAPLPYRRFRSSGGLEIRVGRGARHNDALTFHHSAPGDVWLHARDAAGAHVILRWGQPGNPPARDLGEAAALAALHSKARTSGVVPVDWTLRKHVRKPRGAPPGTVAPDRVRTVMARPDPSLLETLSGDA